jgi:hypothetical protein
VRKLDFGCLLEIPDQGEPAKPLVTVALPEQAPALKYKRINRDQQAWTTVVVETMIAADHKARAIWELAGRMNLSRFAERVKTMRGEAGRAAWEPQLMVNIPTATPTHRPMVRLFSTSIRLVHR